MEKPAHRKEPVPGLATECVAEKQNCACQQNQPGPLGKTPSAKERHSSFPILKILISTFTFAPNKDGVAEASAALAAGLLNRGWKVDIATEPAKPPRSSLDWNGAAIHQFSVAGSTYFRDPFRGDLQKYRDFLAAGRWDVIIFQGYFWPLYLA